MGKLQQLIAKGRPRHFLDKQNELGPIITELQDVVDGHDVLLTSGSGGTGAPTAAAGAQAGGSPPAPVVTATATDKRGKITFGTGSAPAAGNMVAVTFNKAYAAAPAAIVISSGNAATASLQLCVVSISTTGFTLATNNMPAASQANTTYVFYYDVLA